MSDKNNGGPAFPTSKRIGENYMDEAGAGRYRTVTVQQGGMSLRDYAAIKVLPSVYAEYFDGIRRGEHGFDEHWRDEIASLSYHLADAMLRARGNT